MKFKKAITFCNYRRMEYHPYRLKSEGFTLTPINIGVSSQRERGFIPYESKLSMIFKFKKNLGRDTRNFRTGFTLVELIVSMALFIVVVFITTSAFLTLSTLSKKANTTRAAMDNLSTAVEFMARSIRTGYTYHCANDLSGVYSGSDLKNGAPNGFANNDGTPGPKLTASDCSGLPYIAFATPDGDVMFSRLDDIRYNISPQGTRTIRWGRSLGTKSGDITSTDIYINSLKFYVIGADNTSGAANQPRVNIVVQGTAGTDPRIQTKFSIYTSVTQRSPK